MTENLVGYLLNALQPDEHQAVEKYLREHPQAQEQLALLRRALVPLAVDAEIEPPPHLSVRTLAHVAQFQCRTLPFAPAVSAAQSSGSGRSRWRRPDVFVAAALLFIVTGATLTTMMTNVWPTSRLSNCRNNLQHIHTALVRYSNQHQGNFPKVEESPPYHQAGMFMPVLRQSGFLDDSADLRCRPPDEDPIGCYAYNLGYRVNKKLHGLRIDSGDNLPIVADRPPFREGGPFIVGNSDNHQGKGQNVLRIGGPVTFHKDRQVGNKNDIYLNRRGKVAAGIDKDDMVLGASWAGPGPPED